MRTMKWLLTAGLIAATTAACTAETGYYGSSYGYPSSSYSSGYYAPSSSGYYRSSPYSGSSYYSAQSVPRRGPYGDYDRDGIPNRYDRDANGDGIPDRYQR